MLRYDGTSNLESRTDSLDAFGHSSSVWQPDVIPPERGHLIEIIASCYVSRPCWEAICEAANFIDAISMDFRKHIPFTDYTTPQTIHQFFFSDFDIAERMAQKVQKSARNKRKDVQRRLRLVGAGGFHDSDALGHLFEIQRGRCYYSGDQLRQDPKNYVVDHIHPINLGGTDWPHNLALTTKEINLWKGGLASAEDTLNWIAEKRGAKWMRLQKAFCLEVDRERLKYDREFQKNHLTG